MNWSPLAADYKAFTKSLSLSGLWLHLENDGDYISAPTSGGAEMRKSMNLLVGRIQHIRDQCYVSRGKKVMFKANVCRLNEC